MQNELNAKQIVAWFREKAEKYAKLSLESQEIADRIEAGFTEEKDEFSASFSTVSVPPRMMVLHEAAHKVREYIERAGPRRPAELAKQLGLTLAVVRKLPDDPESGLTRNQRGWIVLANANHKTGELRMNSG